MEHLPPISGPSDNHPEGLLYCPSCRELRHPSEFFEIGYQVASADSELDELPTACQRCRTMGPPPIDQLVQLSRPQHSALEGLSEGLSIPDAARKAGMKPAQLRQMLDGNDRHPMRIAWGMILVREGITMDRLAKVLSEALDADEHKYHPADKEFKSFPDHRTRLTAVRHANSQMGLDAPKEAADKGQGSSFQVIVQTTLGKEDKTKVVGGYRVTVPKDVEDAEVVDG